MAGKHTLLAVAGVDEAEVHLRSTVARGIHQMPLPWTLLQGERITFDLGTDGLLTITREITRNEGRP